MRFSKTFPQHQGFTLIEVLIALMIFAIIATIGMSGLQAVVLTDSRQETINKDLSELQFAYIVIQRDLAQAINRPIKDTQNIWRPGFLGAQRAGLGLPFDLSIPGDLVLEFTRMGVPNPQQLEERSSLQRISYFYNGKELFRYVFPMLDRVDKSPESNRILLKDITELQFTYFDRYGQRFNQWATQVVEQPDWLGRFQQMAVMPAAMEWRFIHPRYGNIVWIFALTGTDYEEIR